MPTGTQRGKIAFLTKMDSRGLNTLLLTFVLKCLSLSNGQTQGNNNQSLPDYIAPCYRDDPKLSECVRSCMYGVIRKLVHGIPELDIPPIEPLYKDEIDAFNVGGFRMKITNITLKGVSKLIYTWNSASTKTKAYDFEGYIPSLEIDASYELSGSFFFIPIRAAGTVDVFGRDIDFRVHSIIDILPVNGVDFVKISDLLMTPYINQGSLWISNLGPLEVGINRLLNNRVNMRFIMDHIAPIVEETVSYIMQKFSNRIFNTVPYDTFLPKGIGPVPVDSVEPINDEDVSLTYKYKVALDKIMSDLD